MKILIQCVKVNIHDGMSTVMNTIYLLKSKLSQSTIDWCKVSVFKWTCHQFEWKQTTVIYSFHENDIKWAKASLIEVNYDTYHHVIS